MALLYDGTFVIAHHENDFTDYHNIFLSYLKPYSLVLLIRERFLQKKPNNLKKKKKDC